MKAAHKILNIIIAVLMLTLGNQVKAQEQGYQWSKWYEGQRRNGSSMDEIIDSYIDSLGNTYVFGQFGKDARQGGLNTPYICPIDSMNIFPNGNIHGVFLAKIDSTGNIIWLKSARAATSNDVCIPWNMVVKDNKITIAFDIFFKAGTWLYFFDTLISASCDHFYQEQMPTYFVTFDMNGNIVDFHDMRLFALSGDHSTTLTVCRLGGFLRDSRFGIDEDNNIHLFTRSGFANGDSLHQAYIIVDNDTNKRHPLDVKKMNGMYFTTSVYYKMDSNWNLLRYRYMIDSIAGWDPHHLVLTANLNFWGDVVIDGDEIYVNGMFECDGAFRIADTMDNTALFVATIYLDSINYLKAEGLRDFGHMPFLIKMNKAGDIEWVQQIYSAPPEYEHSDITQFGPFNGGLALDKNNVYTNCEALATSDAFTEPTYIFLDREHTIPINVPIIAINLTTCYDRNTGTPVDFYIHDSVNKSLYGDLAIVGDEIILHDAFRLSQKTVIAQINKHNKAIMNTLPINYDWTNITCGNMSICDNGWIFRGESGPRAYVDDSIFVGNYDQAAVMTFYYDSSLDMRRRPCPQVDSLWGSISGMVATLSWNGQSGIADYELSYIPEGGNWDLAYTFETSDTSATLTLLYDRCYQFRIRGHCTRKGKPYSSWSEPFTICPQAGIEGIGGTGAIALSPNPATGRVQVLSLGEELKQIEVIDMKGNVVSTFSNTTTFDITDLPQGSYLVKLHTAAGTTLHHKLVKQ